MVYYCYESVKVTTQSEYLNSVECECCCLCFCWPKPNRYIAFKMTEIKLYKCVNCGEPSSALFKTYGPTVLKLTKCDKCKGIVDKYIEYDPVIVMIDLVLMSKEAQRHVLYNTEFKSYWKLLVILIMLETYGVWRSDSLFNIAVNTLCGIQNNSTINSTLLSAPLNLSLPDSIKDNCEAWAEEKSDDADLFLWEKDFYIKFMSTFAGIVGFILTVQSCMQLLKPVTTQNEVSAGRLLRAFTVGEVSVVLTLPTLVWGTDSASATRAAHYALVFAYSFVLFVGVFTVLFECPTIITILVVTVSNITKYSTSFFVTSYIRTFVT